MASPETMMALASLDIQNLMHIVKEWREAGWDLNIHTIPTL